MISRRFLHSIVFSLVLIPVIDGCGVIPQDSLVQPHHDQEKSSSSRPSGFGQAIRDYGQLMVREGEFEAEAPQRPWSSWWYPVRDSYLFESTPPGNSPLEKYDRWIHQNQQEVPRESHAAEYEKKKLYDPNAGPWEGLCNAWSAASLLMPEPVSPVTSQGVTFSVGDLKALIVKNFERVEGLRQYGQRFNGDRIGVFDDIYPEQFHRVLISELFEKKHPLILDKDPGLPVWNTPVWKAHSRLTHDTSDPRVMHVTTWIFGGSPFVESYDYVGTLSVILEYTYDLYGELTQEGAFKVMGGVWTGSSLDDHPDFVTVIPENAKHSSSNPEIRWDDVQEILHSEINK